MALKQATAPVEAKWAVSDACCFIAGSFCRRGSIASGRGASTDAARRGRCKWWFGLSAKSLILWLAKHPARWSARLQIHPRRGLSEDLKNRLEGLEGEKALKLNDRGVATSS